MMFVARNKEGKIASRNRSISEIIFAKVLLEKEMAARISVRVNLLMLSSFSLLDIDGGVTSGIPNAEKKKKEAQMLDVPFVLTMVNENEVCIQ